MVHTASSTADIKGICHIGWERTQIENSIKRGRPNQMLQFYELLARMYFQGKMFA